MEDHALFAAREATRTVAQQVQSAGTLIGDTAARLANTASEAVAATATSVGSGINFPNFPSLHIPQILSDLPIPSDRTKGIIMGTAAVALAAVVFLTSNDVADQRIHDAIHDGEDEDDGVMGNKRRKARRHHRGGRHRNATAARGVVVGGESHDHHRHFHGDEECLCSEGSNDGEEMDVMVSPHPLRGGGGVDAHGDTAHDPSSRQRNYHYNAGGSNTTPRRHASDMYRHASPTPNYGDGIRSVDI